MSTRFSIFSKDSLLSSAESAPLRANRNALQTYSNLFQIDFIILQKKNLEEKIHQIFKWFCCCWINLLKRFERIKWAENKLLLFLLLLMNFDLSRVSDVYAVTCDICLKQNDLDNNRKTFSNLASDANNRLCD